MMFITIHYMKHSRAKITDGKMNLHKTKSSHRIAFKNEKFLIHLDVHHQDRCEFLFLQEMANIVFEEKVPRKDNYCTSFCLQNLYLTKNLKINLKPVVLHLYYKKVTVGNIKKKTV